MFKKAIPGSRNSLPFFEQLLNSSSKGVFLIGFRNGLKNRFSVFVRGSEFIEPADSSNRFLAGTQCFAQSIISLTTLVVQKRSEIEWQLWSSLNRQVVCISCMYWYGLMPKHLNSPLLLGQGFQWLLRIYDYHAFLVISTIPSEGFVSLRRIFRYTRQFLFWEGGFIASLAFYLCHQRELHSISTLKFIPATAFFFS